MFTATTEPQKTYTGRCLCKGVGFTVEGPPTAVYCCYCNDCALGAGGPCQITAAYPSPKFILHDPDNLLATYAIDNTLSGHPKEKCFCKSCGCTIYTIPRSNKVKSIVIRPALIPEGLAMFQPTIECFAKQRPSYFSMCEETVEYDTVKKNS